MENEYMLELMCEYSLFLSRPLGLSTCFGLLLLLQCERTSLTPETYLFLMC